MANQLSMLQQAQDTLVDLAIKFGPKLFVATLFLIAGFYAGRWVGRIFDRSLTRLALEPPVRLLLVRLMRLVVLALFLVMALQNLGIDLLPLIAGVSVAGAGIALAMQGVLSNLVAGLTIIFTHPFHLGEYVSIAGVEGRIESIDLFSTKLSHPDQSIVVVPNRKIVGEILHNYGRIRQLDMSIAIGRAEDLEQTLAAIHNVVTTNARVLKEPAPLIAVTSLGAGSIVISVKPWVQVPDYIAATGEINQAIVERILAAGVDYPAAQVVRLVGAQPGGSSRGS